MSDDAELHIAASLRETLTGDGFGRDVGADVSSVSSETLVGDQYGRDIVADVRHVVREVLIQEPPIRVATVLRETIVSVPGDPTSLAYLLPQTVQTTVQVKATADPSDLWSMTSVAAAVSMAVLEREMSISRSPALTGTLDTLVTLARELTPGDAVISPLDVGQAVTLTTMSREHAYEPVSEVAAKTLDTLVVADRQLTPAGDIISPLDARSLTTTVTVAIELDLPMGGQWTGKNVQLAVQAHPMGTPYSVPMVSSEVQLAVLARETIPPFTFAHVKTERQLTTQARDDEWPLSTSRAAGVRLLAVQERGTDMPVSELRLGRQAQLAAQQREMAHPDNVTGVTTAATWSEVSRARAMPLPGAISSTSRVGSVRVQFNIGRTMPHPDEVLDPSMGRHVTQLVRLSVSYRHTEPPTDTGEYFRNLYSLGATPVLRDTAFPTPPTEHIDTAFAELLSLSQVAVLPDDSFPPQSRLRLLLAAEATVIADAEGWSNPFFPSSNVRLSTIGAPAVLVDNSLPDPNIPQSDVQVRLAAETVVLADDGLPDPTIPRSDVRLTQTAASVLLADDSLPAGDVPRSDANVAQVAQEAVLRDTAIDGQFPASPAAVHQLAMRLVLVDPTLYVLPARPAGPRPIISISIS